MEGQKGSEHQGGVNKAEEIIFGMNRQMSQTFLESRMCCSLQLSHHVLSYQEMPTGNIREMLEPFHCSCTGGGGQFSAASACCCAHFAWWCHSTQS